MVLEYNSPQKFKDLKKLTHISKIYVQEKIDGSQFSFWFDEEWKFKSRNNILPSTDKQFKLAIDGVLAVSSNLDKSFLYRGEFLCKPRHNVMLYERVPKHNIVIFDIECNDTYLTPEECKKHCDKVDLEYVQIVSILDHVPEVKELDLTFKSMLGGEVEGVVLKSYDNKQFFKYVRETFKETRTINRVNSNNKTKLLEELAKGICTEARWHKAIQHLKEDNKELNTAEVCKEIHKDIEKEEMTIIQEFIKEHNLKYEDCRKQLMGLCCRGIHEWLQDKI